MKILGIPVQTPNVASLIVAVVVVVSLTLGTPAVLQAQANRVWAATDGCFYQNSGDQVARVECQQYDPQIGTWVATNARGVFYQLNGQWYTAADYNVLVALRSVAGTAPQPDSTIIINANPNPQGMLGSTPGNTTTTIHPNPNPQGMLGSTPPEPCLLNFNQKPLWAQQLCLRFMNEQNLAALPWVYY